MVLTLILFIAQVMMSEDALFGMVDHTVSLAHTLPTAAHSLVDSTEAQLVNRLADLNNTCDTRLLNESMALLLDQYDTPWMALNDTKPPATAAIDAVDGLHEAIDAMNAAMVSTRSTVDTFISDTMTSYSDCGLDVPDIPTPSTATCNAAFIGLRTSATAEQVDPILWTSYPTTRAGLTEDVIAPLSLVPAQMDSTVTTIVTRFRAVLGGVRDAVPVRAVPSTMLPYRVALLLCTALILGLLVCCFATPLCISPLSCIIRSGAIMAAQYYCLCSTAVPLVLAVVIAAVFASQFIAASCEAIDVIADAMLYPLTISQPLPPFTMTVADMKDLATCSGSFSDIYTVTRLNSMNFLNNTRLFEYMPPTFPDVAAGTYSTIPAMFDLQTLVTMDISATLDTTEVPSRVAPLIAALTGYRTTAEPYKTQTLLASCAFNGSSTSAAYTDQATRMDDLSELGWNINLFNDQRMKIYDGSTGLRATTLQCISSTCDSCSAEYDDFVATDSTLPELVTTECRVIKTGTIDALRACVEASDAWSGDAVLQAKFQSIFTAVDRMKMTAPAYCHLKDEAPQMKAVLLAPKPFITAVATAEQAARDAATTYTAAVVNAMSGAQLLTTEAFRAPLDANITAQTALIQSTVGLGINSTLEDPANDCSAFGAGYSEYFSACSTVSQRVEGSILTSSLFCALLFVLTLVSLVACRMFGAVPHPPPRKYDGYQVPLPPAIKSPRVVNPMFSGRL